MNFQVTIGFNEEALSAIQGLTAAIRSIGGASTEASAAATATSTAAAGLEAASDAADTGPIYWADNATGHFGKVDTEAEYKAKKKKAAGTYKVTESIYNEKVAELKAKNEAYAQAEKEAAAAAQAEEDAAAAKAEKAAAAKAEKAAADKAEKAAADKAEKAAADKAEKDASSDVPSEEDLIAAFQAYLPKGLSAEERAERHAFVKPLLQRFGVKRATELAEENRALAINLVQRKAAGEDVDPETAEFVAFEQEEDVI